MPVQDSSERKGDHLDLCANADVNFRQKSTLLEEVELLHNALPELSFNELDTSICLFGKRLAAPLVIASMSGGTAEAETLNRALAAAAEKHRIAFALGSQRAALRSSGPNAGFFVRDVAPTTLLLGNIGAVQAAASSSEELREKIVNPCGLDALCVHLNPAQEMIQPEGDRDFRGCEAALARLSSELDLPVVAKETGAGLSRAVGQRLVAAGIRWVDLSGAGGTSWVGVESLRAKGEKRGLAGMSGEEGRTGLRGESFVPGAELSGEEGRTDLQGESFAPGAELSGEEGRTGRQGESFAPGAGVSAEEGLAELGEVFWDWGIPTGASLCQLSGLGLNTIATGGIRTGLDVARAIVLGASAAGVARPFLQAWKTEGVAGIDRLIASLVKGLKIAMLLTGSSRLEELGQCLFKPGPRLEGWIVRDSEVGRRAIHK